MDKRLAYILNAEINILDVGLNGDLSLVLHKAKTKPGEDQCQVTNQDGNMA